MNVEKIQSISIYWVKMFKKRVPSLKELPLNIDWCDLCPPNLVIQSKSKHFCQMWTTWSWYITFTRMRLKNRYKYIQCLPLQLSAAHSRNKTINTHFVIYRSTVVPFCLVLTTWGDSHQCAFCSIPISPRGHRALYSSCFCMLHQSHASCCDFCNTE